MFRHRMETSYLHSGGSFRLRLQDGAANSPLLLGLLESQNYGNKILRIFRNYLPIEEA